MTKQARVQAADLRPCEALRLVGSFDHFSESAIRYPRQDHQHLYAWLEIPAKGIRYECAIKTRLTETSRMQYCCLREPCPVEEWPEFGVFYEMKLSYARVLGLRQSDFSEVHRLALTDELKGLLSRSARIQVFGFAYDSANGVRHIHMNSGERQIQEGYRALRQDMPDQDGALVLYFDERPGIPAHALWVCLKFENQRL